MRSSASLFVGPGVLVLALVLAACGDTDRGSPGVVPAPSTSLAPPRLDQANPLVEQRAKWPEQVAQLEELIASEFLLEHGGSAAVIDGVLHIELFSTADAEEALRRWPDAEVTLLGPVEY